MTDRISQALLRAAPPLLMIAVIVALACSRQGQQVGGSQAQSLAPASADAPQLQLTVTPREATKMLGGSGFEPGGSNYQYWYLARTFFTTDDAGLDLIRPGKVRMVVGNFHMAAAERDSIASQLRAMYRNGQRKVSLPIHYMRTSDKCEFLSETQCKSGEFDYDGSEAWGINVWIDASDPDGWKFSPKVMANITALIGMISDIGFNEVQFRLMPESHGINPKVCAEWYDQRAPRGQWSLARSLIDHVNAFLAGREKRINVMYDLGAEYAGYQRDAFASEKLGCGDGRVRNAMVHIWREYACRASRGGWPHTKWTADSALAHTVGFTFAGRVRRQGKVERHNAVIYDQVVDVYDYALLADSTNPGGGYICGSGPQRPAIHALDLYTSGGDDWGLRRCRGSCLDRELFTEIRDQLRRLGAEGYPIALWEAPYNSKLMYDALAYATSTLCLNIRTVMQWPAYWEGTQAPHLGRPLREVAFNVETTPEYMYKLPPCKGREGRE